MTVRRTCIAASYMPHGGRVKRQPPNVGTRVPQLAGAWALFGAQGPVFAGSERRLRRKKRWHTVLAVRLLSVIHEGVGLVKVGVRVLSKLGAGSLTACRSRKCSSHPFGRAGRTRVSCGARGSIKWAAVLGERGHDKQRARPSVPLAPWSGVQARRCCVRGDVHAVASCSFALARLRRARQRISPSRRP
jgi:hypothetical protein